MTVRSWAKRNVTRQALLRVPSPAGCQPEEPQGEGGGWAGAGRTPPLPPRSGSGGRGAEGGLREPHRPQEAEPGPRGLALLPALPPQRSVHVRAPLSVCASSINSGAMAAGYRHRSSGTGILCGRTPTQGLQTAGICSVPLQEGKRTTWGWFFLGGGWQGTLPVASCSALFLLDDLK